jgi:hypothetical protein
VDALAGKGGEVKISRWVDEELECAPLAVQARKVVVIAASNLPNSLVKKLFEKLDSVQKLSASEDYREGSKAFVGKGNRSGRENNIRKVEARE